MKLKLVGLSGAKRPRQLKYPSPLFQGWFGLSRKLNNNFADNKKFCIVFFFGGISFKDVVTRRENSFFASSVIFSFCKFVHDNNCVVNRKARILYHNKMPSKLHRRHCLFNFSAVVLNYMAMKIIKVDQCGVIGQFGMGYNVNWVAL